MKLAFILIYAIALKLPPEDDESELAVEVLELWLANNDCVFACAILPAVSTDSCFA